MTIPYLHLLEEVRRIAEKCGRTPEEITLIAVSKNHPWEDVVDFYQAGCRDFGENRIQEALEKIPEAPKNIHWHFIGPLQKNKVNKAIGKFTLIHSIDSIELAKKVSDASIKEGVITPILIEVNTSGEVSKHGFHESDLEAAFQVISGMEGVHLDGLMTMAPLTNDKKVIRRCFSRLRHLRDLIKENNCQMSGFHHLSMGMSNDYAIAIEEGATLLRIGSALFITP